MSQTYALRYAVLQRDNFTCRYCGQSAPQVILQVDHVTPVSEGGKTEMDNLVTSCNACNYGKQMLAVMYAQPIQHPKGYVPRIHADTLSGKALAILRESGPQTIPQLAAALGSQQNTIRTMLHRLLHHGLVVHNRTLWELAVK